MDETRNTSRRIAPQHMLDAIPPAPPLDAVRLNFANPKSPSSYMIADWLREAKQ